MKNLFLQLLKDEEGQGMVEYGIIIALISVVAIGVISQVGGKVNGAFDKVNTDLQNNGIPDKPAGGGGTN